MTTIKYPVLNKDTKNIKCHCGAVASVIGIFGEHEDALCAECYVRENLQHITVEITDGECDLSGTVVGRNYYIADRKFPEFEPYNYGFKNLSFLKPIADRIECIGEELISGKRSKRLKVILKPEYQAIVDSNHIARRFSQAVFYPSQLERTRRDVLRLPTIETLRAFKEGRQ